MYPLFEQKGPRGSVTCLEPVADGNKEEDEEGQNSKFRSNKLPGL